MGVFPLGLLFSPVSREFASIHRVISSILLARMDETTA
jgi:hypothetical protein